MSVKKLLCGAALASLMIAPAASALDLKPSAAGSTIKLASELDLDGTAVTGDLPAVTVTTTTDLPVADDYRLTINLTGGVTFNSFSPTADVLAVAPGVIAGQITSTGGGDTETQVVVLFDVTTALSAGLELTIPVSVDSCDSNVSMNIVLEDNNGNPIEGGSASLTEFGVSTDGETLIECGPAFTASVIDDSTSDDGIDSKLSLASNFEDFLVAVNAGAGSDDAATAAVLSIVAVDVDTSFDKDLAGTAVGFADIVNLSYNLTFDDVTGFATDEIDGADINGTATVTHVDTAAPVLAVTVDPGADSIDTEIILNLTGTEAPVVQNPMVSDVVLDLGAVFSDKSITVTGYGADDLNLEGASFGPYDWVGDASKGTANIFRVTGVDATPPSAAVTLSNSSEGVDGTWTMTLDPASVSNGEYIIRPSDIEAAAGSAFGRADVTFTFFTSDNLDVDRLMSAGGVISAFGNAANADD